MGSHNDDAEGSLEAPRRARSDVQVGAFDKARANRAAILAASALVARAAPPSAPAAPPVAPPPAAPPSAPAAPQPAPAPAAKPWKSGADKGKHRGHLVRHGSATATHQEPEEE